MKTFKIKQYLALGLTLAGVALTPNLHATVSLFIEGGSASSSVILKELTALYGSGTITTNISSAYPGALSKNTYVYELSGTSTLTNLTNYGNITIDVNLANGAIAGLDNLIGAPDPAYDTNYLGTPLAVTLVDSATTPAAVAISSSGIDFSRPTYVVPLVFAKNTNGVALATVTKLTQRQAVTLETATVPATFFGSTYTNLIYFVGRNNNAAVRTEIDAVINNSGGIVSYTNAGGGVPVQDFTTNTLGGPGLPSASLAVANAQAITNSITTIAVQNITTGLQALNYEGVPYSVTNVINGSYALWGNEYYYTSTGLSDPAKLAVINQLYKQVTNNVVLYAGTTTAPYGGNFVPLPWLKVTRNNVDGGPILLNPGY